MQNLVKCRDPYGIQRAVMPGYVGLFDALQRISEGIPTFMVSRIAYFAS